MLSCFFYPTLRYLAGTEEGHIHKCSCSYNEQYLENYHGHTVWNMLYFIDNFATNLRVMLFTDKFLNLVKEFYLVQSLILCYLGSSLSLAMVAILVRRVSQLQCRLDYQALASRKTSVCHVILLLHCKYYHVTIIQLLRLICCSYCGLVIFINHVLFVSEICKWHLLVAIFGHSLCLC